MLIKVKDCLVNLGDIKYFVRDELRINKSSSTVHTINILTKCDSKFSTEYIDQIGTKEEIDSIWKNLKNIDCLFYEVTPNILINLQNVSSILKTSRGLKITFIGEKLSNHNLLIHNEELQDIDKILNEMSSF